MRDIDKIIVHCSDSSEYTTVDDIRKWHTDPKPQGNGWSDIGYHYIIYPDGAVHNGRSVGVAGAHCYGHNRNSIGICLIGKNQFTQQQFKALRQTIDILNNIFEGVTIHGHREFNDNKTCPNFDINEVL